MTKKLLKNLYETTDYVKYQNEEYILKSKYKIGVVKVFKETAALEVLGREHQKIYIDFEKLNGAFNNDIVLVQVIFNPKGKTKAKVLQILQQSNNEILCYVYEKKVYSVKEKIEISISLKDSDTSCGDVILVNNGKIINTLGNISDPKIDEQISLYLYNELYRINDEFNFPINNPITTGIRKDIRGLEFCTIDPVGAKDFDDAVYFDESTNELYVAIADVSSFIEKDSPLDLEAKKRAFSIYLPHKVLPMLPFELSNNLCSLVPNEDRLAYVFKMKLDLKKVSVVSSELFEATINSKQRYTYEEIDDILDANNDSNYFVRFFNLTKKFRDKRLKKGYDFRSDEIRLQLDKNHLLDSTTIENSTPSHSLIEECMLLANQEAAKRLKTNGIFRVHDEPSEKKIIQLVDDVNSLGLKVKLKADIHSTIESIQQKAKNADLEQEVDDLIIQSQQQARYSNLKHSHFGLGFDDYSHFTSPIRRYADLVLHRILKTEKIPKDIEHVCNIISETEREIAQLVWDYEDRKYARWANENLDRVFSAFIIDTENFIVELDDKIKGVRVYINNYSGEKLFSKVNVVLLNSDIISKKITGKLVV